MKSILFSFTALVGLLLCSCSDLDLSAQDEVSTGNWFQTAEQFEMNLNALLHHTYWPEERNEWGTTTQEIAVHTDDITNRQTASSYWSNTMNASHVHVTRLWNMSYTGINRCNKILTEIDKVAGNLTTEQYNRIVGCAIFYRACFYARIMFYFGNPVVVPEDLDLDTEEGRNAGYEFARSDKWDVLKDILADFDKAAELLPKSYGSGEVERATKGAAYACKARTALHFASIRRWDTFGDADETSATALYETARDAAKSCMDLGVYTLHSDFGNLFVTSTKHSSEGIFTIPRSKSLSNESTSMYLNGQAITAKLPRLSGASTCCTCCPSWDLLCAFICTDGLPIDESPLYDPHEPFKNRDPRCAYTIVEFGTEHLGVVFDPHYDSDKVYSYTQNEYITNNDSQTYKISGSSNQYASYSGLVFRKKVDKDWLSPFEADPDKLVMRYAEVLLIYAEAKVELGECDDDARNAINQVRARAYQVSTASNAYPAVTETEQTKLRKIIRTERRMEFALEGSIRLWDIWRWRIGETVYNGQNLGVARKNQTLQRKWVDGGMWFHGATPTIDDNGCPDFTKVVAFKDLKNKDIASSQYDERFFNDYAQVLTTRMFVAPKMYLFPIPTTTTNVMPNLAVDNNPGW
jgi:hypothetical protein